MYEQNSVDLNENKLNEETNKPKTPTQLPPIKKKSQLQAVNAAFAFDTSLNPIPDVKTNDMTKIADSKQVGLLKTQRRNLYKWK